MSTGISPTDKMFKIILCVVFAVAAADPQLLVPGYSSTFLEPATTTITRQASSVVNSPFLYPGFDHLIKKRAVPLINSYWDAPYALPYVYSNPLAPVVSAAHLIKKRAVLAPVGPIAYTHPGLTYSSIPAIADGLPLVSAFDNLHFIKKRQAVWPAPINYVSSPLATAVIPDAPLWSAGLPFIKK